MAEIVVEGGRRLEGEVLVSGSKNAALPLLFSTLLTPERCVLRNVPALADIRTALAVLRHLGARVAVSPDGHEVVIEARPHLHRGAVRPREDHAGVLPRSGPAAGALRTRARLDARRLCDRGASRGPAPGRPREDGRADPHP